MIDQLRLSRSKVVIERDKRYDLWRKGWVETSIHPLPYCRLPYICEIPVQNSSLLSLGEYKGMRRDNKPSIHTTIHDFVGETSISVSTPTVPTRWSGSGDKLSLYVKMELIRWQNPLRTNVAELDIKLSISWVHITGNFDSVIKYTKRR